MKEGSKQYRSFRMHLSWEATVSNYIPIKMDSLEEMDKFLERYKPPRFNQEEIKSMNRLITSTEIKTVIKSLPTDGFTGKFYQTFREELILIILKLFPKNVEKGIPSNSFYEAPSPGYQSKIKIPHKKL